MRPTSWLALSVAVSMAPLMGCGDSPVGSDGLDATDQPSDCAAYSEWLLERYAPLAPFCEGGVAGPSCVGQAPLEEMPWCDDPSAAYASWMMAYQAHIFYPWQSRYIEANNDFMMAASPHVGDHQRFVTVTAVTAEERAAHETLLAIKPAAPRAFDYHFEWLGLYETLVDLCAFPRQTQALVAVHTEGRTACGVGPFDYDADHPEAYGCEPTLFLNSSELAMLAMFEEAAPPSQEDGAFAEWVRFYDDLLRGDELTDLRVHFAFPLSSEAGLAGYELAFFERLRAAKPLARGGQDSRGWLGPLVTYLGAMVDSDQPGELLRLELFEASLPAQHLTGLEAYRTWLGTDLLELGVTFLLDQPVELDRLIPYKPCASDPAELTDMQTELTSLATELPGTDLGFATPSACSDATR